MRKMLLFLLLSLCLVAACKKAPDPLSVNGEWQLCDYQAKSVNIHGTDVDVYISFTADGNFTLYQKLGEGRYTRFTGTFTLSGDILSGKYTSGGSWASQYSVAKEGDKLVLTQHPDAKEVHTFSPASIPASVTENLY